LADKTAVGVGPTKTGMKAQQKAAAHERSPQRQTTARTKRGSPEKLAAGRSASVESGAQRGGKSPERANVQRANSTSRDRRAASPHSRPAKPPTRRP